VKDSLRQQFDRLGLRLAELDAALQDPATHRDIERLRKLGAEQSEVAGVVAQWRRHQQRERELADSRALLDDPDMADLARDDIAAAEAELAALELALQRALLPKDPDDARNAFLEIRAGTGGDESALFAGDLARMYLRFCAQQGWRTEIVSENASDLGGYKELVVRVEGDGAYGRLKFESGGHRVQRVPATESQGRIHTSACTVAVLPEADENPEVALNPAELRIDTFRASGAGGQHVNKTDSAIRITHLPSGLVVECQTERSQHANRDKAMQRLKSALHEQQVAAQQAATAASRRLQVGSGDRSARIRTWNFPQGRVTDHRVEGLTLYALPQILEGDLDPLLARLAEEDRADALKALADGA